MFDELTQFLQQRSDHSDIARIGTALVDLEVDEFTNQFLQLGNKQVLFFEDVAAKRIPVVTNLLGTEERLLKALRIDSFAEGADRLLQALNPIPQRWANGAKPTPRPDLSRLLPRVVKRAACQQVVHVNRDIDLSFLPISIEQQQPFGDYVILRSVHGSPLLLPSRMSIRDGQTLSIQDHRVFHQLKREYGDKQIPVSLAFGGDPAIRPIAQTPIPHELDPFLVAGVLRNESLNLVRAHSVELEVPADAEIVIEGFLVLEQDDWQVRVTAITHRANPILAISTPAEDDACGRVLSRFHEKLLLPIAQQFVPELIDLRFSETGSAGSCLFVQVADEHSLQRLVGILQSFPLLEACTMVAVVFPNVDFSDDAAVWRSVLQSGTRFESMGGSNRVLIVAKTAVSSPRNPEIQSGVLKKLQSLGYAPADNTVDVTNEFSETD